MPLQVYHIQDSSGLSVAPQLSSLNITLTGSHFAQAGALLIQITPTLPAGHTDSASSRVDGTLPPLRESWVHVHSLTKQSLAQHSQEGQELHLIYF